MADADQVAPYALVVDDNPVILLDVADILDELGFCTFTAADSNIGLDCLLERAGQLAVLFTNVQIPGPLDGFALARYAAERWPKIGIIVSSGHAQATDDAMPLGSVFVSKPFTSSDIQAAVRKVMPAYQSSPRVEAALAS